MIKSTLPRMALAALAFSSCAAAANLRPDQEAAIEQLLAAVEPESRELARPMIEQTISSLTPEQVAMVVAGAARNAAAAQAQKAAPPPPKRVATAADLEYNRAQYEPALRKHWEAKRAFDQFVEAEIEAKCPNRDTYAVYREVERYELMPLSPNWQRAAWTAEAEVDVMGKTYAPDDGRYDFDFSKVRMTFDKTKVSNAIANACAEWTEAAKAFKAKAQQLMLSGQSNAALALERTTNAKVSAIDEKLTAILEAEGPAGKFNEAMYDALRNPKRVN